MNMDKNFQEYLNSVSMQSINEDFFFESGLRNINELAKKFSEAIIYFHEDLDGVTSAIGMKNYLERYGIKTIGVHTIQYGDKEYSIPKSNESVLHALVDFANGKYWMNIHTDHHDRQTGAQDTEATSFVKSPSNAEHISSVISPQEVFPPEDLKMISTIDSASFAKEGFTPDDVIRSVFKLDKDKPLKLNKANQGFVVNKLLLSYKNKPDFLKRLVMEAKPSLHSMYLTILNLVRTLPKMGGIDSTKEGTRMYEANQKAVMLGEQPVDKVKTLGVSSDPKRKNDRHGESMTVGNLIVQFGASPLFSGQKYDRYTSFKQYPDAHYLCMIWPMGLIQVSKNPFLKGVNPTSLGDLILGTGEGIKKSGGIIEKFKPQLERSVLSLYDIKKSLESGIKADKIKKDLADRGYKSESDSVGFGADDFANAFKGVRMAGLRKDPEWKKMMRAITDTKFHNLIETEDSYERPVDMNREMRTKGFTPLKKVTKEIKKLTVKDVYPEATEVIAGGDPNKIYAVDVLKQVKIPLWDIVMTSSGGHKDITNISGLGYIKDINGQAVLDKLLRSIAAEIAEQMKDMKLENVESIEEDFKGLFNGI